jgi:mannose-6-phosphate isomerase-like protein (cupin superfamily)
VSLEPDDAVYSPRGEPHSIRNTGKDILRLINISFVGERPADMP